MFSELKARFARKQWTSEPSSHHEVFKTLDTITNQFLLSSKLSVNDFKMKFGYIRGILNYIALLPWLKNVF